MEILGISAPGEPSAACLLKDGKILAAAREGNRPVQVWTVNDEAEMKRFLEMDVQAILTDRPDRLLALMGRERRPQTATP